jgi:hypothetical protein
MEYNVNATMLGHAMIVFSMVTTSILYWYGSRGGFKIKLFSLLLKNFILGLIPFVGIISFFYFLRKIKRCM